MLLDDAVAEEVLWFVNSAIGVDSLFFQLTGSALSFFVRGFLLGDCQLDGDGFRENYTLTWTWYLPETQG